MSDPEKGLYRKFQSIRRTDGRDLPGEKHDGCNYFILDIQHDEFAKPALAAYAAACKEKYPLLAADLERWLKGDPWPLL